MYIEYVLFENLIINYFIVFTAQKILNEKSKLSYLGIIFSTIISLLCPLFNLTVISSVFVKFFTSILITSLCFEMKNFKQAIASHFIFLSSTFLYGGAIEFLNQMLDKLTILYVILCSFALMIICNFTIKFLHKRKILQNFSAKVTIIDKNKVVVEKGYFDSGNLLYDPITSKPICLITQEVFQKLFGGNIIDIFLKKFDEKNLKNGHYISVNSALKSGKMLVFTVEKIIIETDEKSEVFKDVCLGLSFSGFEKAMHSQVLLHSSQAVC